jgi:hypothetical protein
VTRWVAPSVEAAEALIAGTLTWLVAQSDDYTECAVQCPNNARVCQREPGHEGRHEAVLHGQLGSARPSILHWTENVVQQEVGVPTRGVPADYLRAVESGERIEIAANTECPHVDCRGVGDYCCWGCRGKGRGSTAIGTVVATACLPIIWQLDDDSEHDKVTPHVCIFKGRLGGEVFYQIVHFDGTCEDELDPAALSVYGPPASLPGRYAIAVTDARRAG